MEKQKRTYLIKLALWQAVLLFSWYLGERGTISPLAKALLILFSLGGIFYTIYKQVPETRNIFLVFYLLVILIMTWLVILPSLA